MLRALILFATILWPIGLSAQTTDLQTLLKENRSAVEKASRKTVDVVLAAMIDAGLPEVPVFLEKWRDKDVWQRKEDGLFFFTKTEDKKTYQLIDVSTGNVVGEADKKALKNLKPNSGVRGVIATALVQFQLMDPSLSRRMEGIRSIERDPEAAHLEPLRGSIDGEDNPDLKARKVRLERLLTLRFDEDDAARITAIEGFKGDLGIDARAALNPILATKTIAIAGEVNTALNVAETLVPGKDISIDAAYELLVSTDLAPSAVTKADIKMALTANIVDGQIAGVNVGTLGSDAAREEAYIKLAAMGIVSPLVSKVDIDAALSSHTFLSVFSEPSKTVTNAAIETLGSINTAVGINQTADLFLDGLSLASIYFLAAIGLAITFGVMGVINMAHGEFIMMGAYTGYVVQLFVPDYTLSIILALPLAFGVTFAAGVAMERLVIRYLYHRPLETLLATFGISIALQQIAKNIFGTQARPLTSPGWLDGALVINDVVSISYIRIAIFILALIFLAVLLYILNKTRLGLEVRAVTQNPRMAASMGINPDKINMLTFGLGSGIAGIAGVAIGLYAKVTSELGADYIVQSFMTVVVGGVGNIWGTLLGASMIGFLQKGIEFLNPSNTLAAQTYMILFIILFIQFRPKGIIALKGRATEA